MNAIEQYLSGAVEYEALSNAEKCAICAAMEGRFPFPNPGYPEYGMWLRHRGEKLQEWPCKCDDYLNDGTAALRLVERFRIDLCPAIRIDDMSEGWGAGFVHSSIVGAEVETSYADTVSAAIVAAVCALARAQYPYKVNA